MVTLLMIRRKISLPTWPFVLITLSGQDVVYRST